MKTTEKEGVHIEVHNIKDGNIDDLLKAIAKGIGIPGDVVDTYVKHSKYFDTINENFDKLAIHEQMSIVHSLQHKVFTRFERELKKQC